MKQGETLSPYRNFLADAVQNLEAERAVLGTRAATLGALRSLLPRGLRRDLARLERAIQRPVQDAHDVELAWRSLDAYAERVEVAIAFSDHVARDRAMRHRQLRTWFSWAAGAGAALIALAALVVVDDLSQPPPTLEECRLGAVEGYSALGTQSPMSEAANHCGLSVVCARDGRCNTAPDGCYAASDADCLASWGCKVDGLCRARAGVCVSPGDPAPSGALPVTRPVAGNGPGLH